MKSRDKIKKNIPKWLLLFVVMTSGCSFLPKEQVYQVSPVVSTKADMQYEFAVVLRGDIEEKITFPVTAKATEKSTLSFQVSSEKYKTVFVKEGESVKKGQLLAELDVDSYKKKAAELENEIKYETIALEGLKDLENAYGIRPSDYEKKSAEVNNNITYLKEALNENNVFLQERQIYADMDGVVSSIFAYEKGELSVEGKEFITLISSEQILEGSTNQWQSLEVGKEYEIVISKTSYPVRITEMEEKGEEMKTVRMEPAESAYQTLDLSGVVTGEFSYVTKQVKNCLFLPKQVVYIKDGKSYVYQLDQQGFREQKEIQTGEVLGENIVILNQLEEGENVICN